MNDIFGRIVSIFLACAIFFGLPLVYMNERAKTAEQLYILTNVTHFVDSVCNVGKVDKQMMQRFEDSLSVKNRVYSIQILHETKDYVYDEEQDGYERVSRFYDETDIRSALQQGSYYFYRGDFFRVQVQRVAGFSLPFQQDQTVSVMYGGSIRYEAF